MDKVVRARRLIRIHTYPRSNFCNIFYSLVLLVLMFNVDVKPPITGNFDRLQYLHILWFFLLTELHRYSFHQNILLGGYAAG